MGNASWTITVNCMMLLLTIGFVKVSEEYLLSKIVW
jgi:hypothetical protein